MCPSFPPGNPPTNKATATPACVTADQFASGGTLLLDCQITNTATDATVTYQYYLNGKLIADSKLLQAVYPKNVFEIDPVLTIIYGSMGSDFDPRGTYQCIATTLWGTAISTAVFSICSEFGHCGRRILKCATGCSQMNATLLH